MSDAKTILVVDDEPDAIEFVTAVISQAGEFNTISATDGVAGLQKAKEANPDLAILDVQMPGKNGFDVFQELRKDEATRNIKVIMLTGVAEKTGIGFSSAEMGEFYGEEPNAYIEKPVDPEALKSKILELIGS